MSSNPACLKALRLRGGGFRAQPGLVRSLSPLKAREPCKQRNRYPCTRVAAGQVMTRSDTALEPVLALAGHGGWGGEEEQAVVSKIWEFQACGICYLGVSIRLGVSAATEKPPTPVTGPDALSYF